MSRSFVILALVALAATARADTLRLRRGGVLDGIVTDGGDTWIVEMPTGRVEIGKELVASVEKKETPLTEYKARAAALSPDDTDGWCQLAQWAQSNGFESLAEEDYRRVLEADPDNATARTALGYERVDGNWMTRDEVMAAKGLVQVDGEWVTRDQAERMKTMREQREIEIQEAQAQAAQAAEAAEQERVRRLEEERQAQVADEQAHQVTFTIFISPGSGDGSGAAPFAAGTRYFAQRYPGYYGPGHSGYPTHHNNGGLR